MTGILQAILMGYGAAGGGTFNVVQTFTASGTWTAPTGVTSVDYLVVAGGGGGGSVETIVPAVGGIGGGGNGSYYPHVNATNGTNGLGAGGGGGSSGVYLGMPAFNYNPRGQGGTGQTYGGNPSSGSAGLVIIQW